MNDVAHQGPKRGADRAVLLAHGAGADMHAAALTTVADALAAAKIPSLRFNFPYKAAGRRGPDRPPVLEAALRDAARELAARAKVPADRLVLGGRSMGGRIGSMVAAQDGALGVVLLGYPLHPPGKADQLRVDHFPKLTMPVLFASGTRDAFGAPDELRLREAVRQERVGRPPLRVRVSVDRESCEPSGSRDSIFFRSEEGDPLSSKGEVASTRPLP